MQHPKARILLPILALAPRALFAQEGTPRIYIVPPRVVAEDNRVSDGLQAAILGAVGENPVVLLSPELSTQSDGDIAALQGKLKEGQQLAASEPEKAIEALKAAAEGFEGAMSGLGEFDLYL